MKFIRQKKLKNKVFCEIFGKHAVYAAIKNANRKHQELYFTKNHRDVLEGPELNVQGNQVYYHD